MSYEALEGSVFGGQPVELYKFVRRDQCWLYTSADEDVVEGADSYQAVAIWRGAVVRSQESTSSELDVHLSLNLAIVPPFITSTPATPVSLTIRRLHRDDADPIVFWSGEVAAAEVEGQQVTMHCVSPLSSHEKSVPRLVVQRQCPNVLYDKSCGLDPEDFKTPGTVSAISSDGIQVTVPESDPLGDGFFKAGWLQITGTDIRSFITKHSGDVVTLLTPAAGLGVSVAVDLFAGCDRTVQQCRDRFDNVANHLGMPLMPERNPFVQLEAKPR